MEEKKENKEQKVTEIVLSVLITLVALALLIASFIIRNNLDTIWEDINKKEKQIEILAEFCEDMERFAQGEEIPQLLENKIKHIINNEVENKMNGITGNDNNADRNYDAEDKAKSVFLESVVNGKVVFCKSDGQYYEKCENGYQTYTKVTLLGNDLESNYYCEYLLYKEFHTWHYQKVYEYKF